MMQLTRTTYKRYPLLKSIRVKTLYIVLKNLWKICDEPYIKVDIWDTNDILKKEVNDVNSISVIKKIDNDVVFEVNSEFINIIIKGYYRAKNKKSYYYSVINFALYAVSGIQKLTTPLPIGTYKKIIKLLDMSVIPQIAKECGNCIQNTFCGNYCDEKVFIKGMIDKYNTVLDILF